MKKILLNVALGMTVVLVACKKDEPTPEPDPTPNPTSNLGGMFDSKVNAATQTFTINASSYSSITGTNGVQIYIPANSFEDANGNIVSGNVTLKLVEVLDQSSMILLNKTTTSDGNLLVSGGELKLTAQQGSSTVYLADNASLTVMVPTDNYDANMQLFDGVEDLDGNVDWTLSLDSTGTADSVGFVPDSSSFFGGYYYFDWTDSSLGWINCDYFYYNSSDPLTTVSVDPDGSFNGTNTAVFLHFSSINSVAPLWYDGTAYFSSYTNSVPEGMGVTAVCISEISGQYYSAFVPATVTTNLVIPVTMTATTLSDIEAAIDNL